MDEGHAAIVAAEGIEDRGVEDEDGHDRRPCTRLGQRTMIVQPEITAKPAESNGKF
jgi:hypothetical protein